MTTGDDNAVLVDTNILVYAATPTSPFHAAAYGEIERRRKAGEHLWISTQIIREFAATITNPRIAGGRALSAVELSAAIRYLHRRFHVAEDRIAVSRELSKLLVRFPDALSRIHDTNLVATCQVYRIPRILTHNVRDFRRFASLIAIESLPVGNVC